MPDQVRRLLLLRHAHAGFTQNGQDLERSLSERGLTEALEVGGLMATEGFVPDIAVISPALRTRQTWAQVQKRLPMAIQCLYESRVYEAGISTLLDVLGAQPDSRQTVLVVGHNPGMQGLALKLTGRGSKNAVVRLRHEFPPASLAVITFQDTRRWVDIDERSGVLEHFMTPLPVS
ncbi:MAG: phosphoglycerate mutase [Pusillimonas sp.]|jgi:phosphohistidine phosphatase|nr:phosphoglycerate mutase [Pusillimonas sp.]MBC43651.1 phosphoglycerate mutase [Pusillimonas sp.]HCP76330.1 phosphoglycerate mutase [Pusillimonas sp.]|tara:strand:+ start:71314 stop:71841 length:528 start_codon:yes stop_codon:yes gene_type:complete